MPLVPFVIIKFPLFFMKIGIRCDQKNQLQRRKKSQLSWLKKNAIKRGGWCLLRHSSFIENN